MHMNLTLCSHALYTTTIPEHGRARTYCCYSWTLKNALLLSARGSLVRSMVRVGPHEKGVRTCTCSSVQSVCGSLPSILSGPKTLTVLCPKRTDCSMNAVDLPLLTSPPNSTQPSRHNPISTPSTQPLLYIHRCCNLVATFLALRCLCTLALVCSCTHERSLT